MKRFEIRIQESQETLYGPSKKTRVKRARREGGAAAGGALIGGAVGAHHGVRNAKDFDGVAESVAKKLGKKVKKTSKLRAGLSGGATGAAFGALGGLAAAGMAYGFSDHRKKRLAKAGRIKTKSAGSISMKNPKTGKRDSIKFREYD